MVEPIPQAETEKESPPIVGILVLGGPQHGKRVMDRGQNYIYDSVHLYAKDNIMCKVPGCEISFKLIAYVYFGWTTDAAQ